MHYSWLKHSQSQGTLQQYKNDKQCVLFLVALVIPKPLDKGFWAAVIASLISGLIIVAMSIAFAVCCLRDRMLKGAAAQQSENGEE